MNLNDSCRDISINGRFLTQKLSGVQRYSREMVTAVDRLIQTEPDKLGCHRWRMWVPAGTDIDLQLAAITMKATGRGSGHVWEQRDLLRAAAGSRLINLGNSGPVLHRDKLVVIHDAAVFRTPENFSWKYRTTHRLLGKMLALSGTIGTVSEFSRSELASVLGTRKDTIVLARNGCDHFVGRERDDTILDALALEAGRYFFFVGSPAPNKNLAVLLEAFAQIDRRGAKLVVAGSLDRSVFGGEGASAASGVILASRRSDAEIAALYTHATAHVFPSLYEGFGIPPLEAMASGCPVIASDIPVIREVCCNAATYFAPHDAQALTRLMQTYWDVPQRSDAQQAAAAARVARFTWESSARALIDAVLTP